jgi:hypothetical protein
MLRLAGSLSTTKPTWSVKALRRMRVSSPAVLSIASNYELHNICRTTQRHQQEESLGRAGSESPSRYRHPSSPVLELRGPDDCGVP